MRTRGILLGLSVIILLLSCGDAKPPTLPDPDPSPTPEPSPTPDPIPNWPSTSWRWGAWNLYGPGWTVPQEPVVRRLAIAGVTHIGARPGPQSEDGPDAVVGACALVLSALDGTIRAAETYRMRVELALFDLWIIQHGYSCNPSWSFRDFQGDRLTGSQVAWLELLAAHSQSPVIDLLDGNEMFKARPSVAWFRDLKRHVRRLWPGKLLGTNAENRLVEREADFVEIHQDQAVGRQSGKPTGVNETGPISCMAWAKESQNSRRLGTWFDLWSGDMSPEEFEDCLVTHAEIRRASGR